jgi:hypothetical protein
LRDVKRYKQLARDYHAELLIPGPPDLHEIISFRGILAGDPPTKAGGFLWCTGEWLGWAIVVDHPTQQPPLAWPFLLDVLGRGALWFEELHLGQIFEELESSIAPEDLAYMQLT